MSTFCPSHRRLPYPSKLTTGSTLPCPVHGGRRHDGKNDVTSPCGCGKKADSLNKLNNLSPENTSRSFKPSTCPRHARLDDNSNSNSQTGSRTVSFPNLPSVGGTRPSARIGRHVFPRHPEESDVLSDDGTTTSGSYVVDLEDVDTSVEGAAISNNVYV